MCARSLAAVFHAITAMCGAVSILRLKADACAALGDAANAIAAMKEAVDLQKSLNGDAHPNTRASPARRRSRCFER